VPAAHKSALFLSFLGEAAAGLVQGGSWQFAGLRPHLLAGPELRRPRAGLARAIGERAQAGFRLLGSCREHRLRPVGIFRSQTQNQRTAGLAIALAPDEGQGVVAAIGIFPDPAYADSLLRPVTAGRRERFPILARKAILLSTASFQASLNCTTAAVDSGTC